MATMYLAFSGVRYVSLRFSEGLWGCHGVQRNISDVPPTARCLMVTKYRGSGGTNFSWRITDSPTHNINLATNSIDNRDGSKSWLVSPISHTKLPMVFVPIMEMPLDQDASVPSQSYHCDMDGEWMVDQHERRVLWIPPDERPRRYESNRFGSKVVVETESRKVYIVDFHGLEKTGT